MDTSSHLNPTLLNPALVNAIRLNHQFLNHQTLEPQADAVEIQAPTMKAAKLFDSSQFVKSTLSTKMDWIPWLNPELATKINTIREPIGGIPRGQVAVAISPSETMTDELLLESPTDPNQKYYLPRYRIAERNRKIQIELNATGSSWSLTIHLEKYPAPALGLTFRDAEEIPHTVSLILQHRLEPRNASGGQKQLIFEPPIEEVGGLRAVLKVANRNEMDLLYQVLTMPDYGAVLTIQRAIQVALPVPIVNADDGGIRSSGTGTLRGTWLFNFDSGTETDQNSDIWWNQQTETERWLMPQGNAKIINLGVCDFEAIGLAQLQNYTYGTAAIDGSTSAQGVNWMKAQAFMPMKRIIREIDEDPGPRVFIARNQLVNGDVFAVLTNQGNYAKVKVIEYGYNLQLQWVTYSPAVVSEPLFRVVPQVFNDTDGRNPFVFPPALYDYLFSGITGTTGKIFKSDLRQVNGHSYYQDPVDRQIFYYLPDQFKLVRQLASPHYPQVSLKLNPGDRSGENQQVTIDYWAAPFIDQKRLNTDAIELSRWIPNPSIPGPQGVVFQAMLAENPRLFLSLPNPDGSLSVREYPEILVELRTGFQDSRTLSKEAFQVVYDALFSDVTQLFQGHVKVEFPGGPTEVIPFNASINDLLGPYFDITKSIDSSNGNINITLRNAIESPLQINELKADLWYGNTVVAGTFSVFSLPLPAIVNPQESLTVTVMPSDLNHPPNLTDIKFDFSQVNVIKDPAAVFQAILNTTTFVNYERTFKVTVGPRLFEPPLDNPSDPIVMILVDFLDSGQTLELSQTTPTQEFTLQIPMKTFTLNQFDTGAYRYQATFVYAHRDPVKGQIQPGKYPLNILEVA
jgi:hypothetical protein